MAIAGGGSPATQITIHLRQITRIGATHNIPEEVIRPNDVAALHLAAGGSCYVDALAGVGVVNRQLIAWGLVDPPQVARAWWRPLWWRRWAWWLRPSAKALLPAHQEIARLAYLVKLKTVVIHPR